MTTPITTDELTYDEHGKPELDYHALNAQLNLVGENGGLQLDSDKEAARQFFLQHVNGNTWFFHDLEEKIEYLIDNGYYEEEVIEQYSWKFVKDLYKRSYQYKYRFETFLGAFKYYTSYTLKTFDGKRYLERFEDRVVMVALYLGHGNEDEARNILDEMMSGRYQPATPTFLNAGKKQRGELVSCFPAGTPVDTPNGTTKIEDIKEGDLVLSHDGKFHRVEKLLINRNSSPLVSIRHYGTKEPLVSTENHPILVWTDRDIETLIEGDGADPKNGFVWIEAQDVESGDYVVASFPTEIHEQRTFDLLEIVKDESVEDVDGIIKKPNVDKKHRNKTPYSLSFTEVNRFVKEDYNLGLILGWYLSEGYVSKRKNANGDTLPNGVHFTLGTHERAFQKELANAIRTVFGTEVKISDSLYDGSTKISVHSRFVAEIILELMGTGFNTKRLNNDVLTANHEFQEGLVYGAFRGDGCTTNGALVLDLVNPEIIESLQKVLGRLGVISRVRTYTNNVGHITGQLSVPGLPGENEEFILNTGKNLRNYVGLRGGKKNLKNSDFYKFIDGRLVFEVKNVEVLEDGIPETVYNLEVEDTHTYSVRGTVVHNCYLTRIEDNMESISRSITTALQLSKRGGGVALLLTNLRESGAPIKHIENQSSGVVPVMKLLEDSFSYANQLGARQGAGAVYLNVHHPDIMRFLDTKRENADEKVRIKTLSLGVVIPDITFELAKRNEDMYLFSPYDVERVYNKPMSDISITEHYYEMVDNPRIRKSKINARTLFQTIAEIQFESGYPYILFEDTANRDNPIKGRINMSNLCLTGDTRLLTDKGYIRFDDLHASQDDFKVVSDNRSVEEDFEKSSVSLKNSTKAFLTKHDAETFKVSTKEGFEIKATEWHKFFIEEDGEILTKHLSELEIGDHLLVQPEEGAFGTIHNPESAEEAGRSLEGTVSRVLERRGQFVVRSSQTGKNFQFSKISQDTLSVPDFVWKGDRETVLSYLAGVFQVKSDVILNPDDSGIIIELGSSEKKFLQEIQQILLNLGVYSTISVNNDKKITDLFGQYADLVLRIIPGLVSNEDIENLSETLSQNGYNVENLMKMQEGFHKFRATVSSIDFHSVEDVYDVTVPDGHSIIVDGLSTSNCSEILQVNTPSEFNEDGTYRTVGKDISCNLGSLNIARTFDSPDFEKTIESSVRALTTVSDLSNVRSVPTIENGNKKSHAIGLGQMNLHGFLAREHIFYDSPEAVDFTNIYFYSTLYQVLRASNKIARERNETFDGFTESKYYTGEFFTKYIEKDWSHPETEKVRELFKRSNIYIPVPEDWIKLRESIHEYGIYNQNLQAIPPTGSISYINHSTSSIHPIAAPIEIRKEGKLGRVYYPVPFLSDDTLPYYKDAFGIGPKAIIDVYAAAQQHVDQSLSLTLFYLDTATTRDMNRNYVYAFSKGIKTLYYARIRQMALEGTQVEGTATEYCESCQL